MRRLLLVSTSTTFGAGYLDHCAGEMRDLLGTEIREILFVPYALHDREGYAQRASERFARMGVASSSIHESGDPIAAIERAPAIFVGGGNTFRLLRAIREQGLIEPIRRRVAGGMSYLGTSAGSNVACVTIKTTNDMPIVETSGLDALGLVPFNINPHYLDPDPGSTHMGETRETRIREFHEENDPAVIGLREGAMLRVEGDRMWVRGEVGVRVFRRGMEPAEFPPRAALDFLLRDRA